MERIKQFQQQIEEELARTCINGHPDELYAPIRYTLSLGGKRLRPLLVLLGNQLFNGNTAKAIGPALGVEVFHNFTLLHDDIMDNAPLRRNKETVHKKWNNNIAILSGDTMFVLSQQLVMRAEDDVLRNVLHLFNKTAIEVCEGQQLDMNFERTDKVSILQYLHMIKLKTAVLLACSLKTGAYTAHASEEQAQLLYEFGKHMGIAFQLQDDILDVYGNPDKFGKQVGGDIIANKKTFLLLKALELAKLNPYKSEELNLWLMSKEEDVKHKVEAVTAIYNFLGIREIANREMHLQFEKGLACLDKIEGNTEIKELLRTFTTDLLYREV